MNERQKKFCLLVFEGMAASRAYAVAGFKSTGHAAEASASKLMRKPEVVQYLAEMRGNIVEQVIERGIGKSVNKQWVMDRLVENVNRCMQLVPVLDAEGNEKGEFVWNPAGANKALELLGTEIGMFVEKREIDQTIKILTDKPMTNAEWAAKYAPGPPLKLVKPVDRQ